MGDCCTVKSTASFNCPKTGNKGYAVTTRLLYFKVWGKHHDLIDPSQEYRFCDDPKCEVVYFGSQGSLINKEHLKEKVGRKEFIAGGDYPVCHCFNFNKSDLERDVAATGSSDIPKIVSQYIKKKLCSCEINNPSGQCCLGFINQVLKSVKDKKKE